MRRLKRIIAALLVVLAAGGCLGISAGAAGKIAYGAATVDATELNIRTGPGKSYDIISTIGSSAIIVSL